MFSGGSGPQLLGFQCAAMDHLTPAELLRFLEEEANTLQLMNAKVANQLHCLQVEEEYFSRQLSNREKGTKRTPFPTIGSVQSEEDVNGHRDNEVNFQNEIQSEGLEQHSTALYGSADQKLLDSPATPNSSGAGGQEPSQTIELENERHIQKDFPGQQQEQERLEVLIVEEPSPPHRTSGRRISRRPARFQD